MVIPSKFALSFHYVKDIAMLSNCILDPVIYLLISHMFCRDIQKSSIDSHLKGLPSSFQFCCNGQDRRMHQLSLRSNKDVLIFR